jgi:hypothetical protein
VQSKRGEIAEEMNDGVRTIVSFLQKQCELQEIFDVSK